MMYCHSCELNLSDDKFNGNYRYCRTCHDNYRITRRKKRKNTKDTCVYFIKSADLIKIGYTSDLDERKRTLQVNNPTIVEVLKTIPGGYQEEQQLHKQFVHLNKTGEWFYATQELLDFINHPLDTAFYKAIEELESEGIIKPFFPDHILNTRDGEAWYEII